MRITEMLTADHDDAREDDAQMNRSPANRMPQRKRGPAPPPDRHRNRQVCLRATPEQISSWKKTAEYVGEDLNMFLVNAAAARISSMLTAKLKLTKSERACVRAFARAGHKIPCPDPHCAKPADHAGPCDFDRLP